MSKKIKEIIPLWSLFSTKIEGFSFEFDLDGNSTIDCFMNIFLLAF